MVAAVNCAKRSLRVGLVAVVLGCGDLAWADDDEQGQDVVVRGAHGAGGVGADALSRTEVRQLPGAFGDPFRAIEAAPGMVPIVSGLPYFYVRGAPPGNVGYYFDGVRLPYLFHFGLGPAVIHPALIAKTEVYRGGYPASFGRYAGGIVDATAMPASDHAHAEGHVRLIDAGAFGEAPFADGRGSVLVAARYSYTAALFTLLSSDTTLDYRDYQARVSYALTDRDELSLLVFGAYDYAAQRETVDSDTTLLAAGSSPSTRPPEANRVLFASEFHRADARFDRRLAGGGHLRVATTVGFDRTRVDSHRTAMDVMTAARAELTQPLTPGLVVRGATDIVVDRYSADALAAYADDDDVVQRQADLFARHVDFATGARADVVFTMIPRLEIIPGLRFDSYGSGPARAIAVDPRLSARFSVTDKLRIIHAYGVANQPPSTPVTLPGIAVARLRGGLQRSVQTSAGIEADLPEDFTTTATVFHNAFYNLNDALGTAQVELIDIERSDTLLGKSRGSAFGLEVGLRRKLTRRVAGLASYTLSRSLRTADGRSFVSSYDRTHVLTAALSADLGAGFRGGLRLVTYSGTPVAAPTPAFPEQVVGVPPGRTPAFYRVDLRLERRWTIGKSGWLSVVLEALNATLSKEVTGYACDSALGLPGLATPTPGCRERVVGPISVPSLGVEGGL
jgi:hypothetical protein